MKRFRHSERGKAITDINVTPLVDITLVLLIIFMVTTTYIVKLSIPIELPKAGSGEQAGGQLFTIVVGPDEKIYVDGELATEAKLMEKLKAKKAKEKDVQVLLSSDRRVKFERFVRILDIVRRLDITKYAINTIPLDEKDYVPWGGKEQNKE